MSIFPKPPPPTPCSTDVAEESGSDVYGAFGGSNPPRSGYDSEPYEGGAGQVSHIAVMTSSNNNPRRAPPSTPYLSDCEGQEEEDGSETLQCHSQQMFVNDDHINSQLPMQASAPPPSPEPSRTPGCPRRHEF